MKQTKGSKPVAIDEDDLEVKRFGEVDDDDQEESQGPPQNRIVSKFIRMLPRAVFMSRRLMAERAQSPAIFPSLENRAFMCFIETMCLFMWARQKENSSPVYGHTRTAFPQPGVIFGIIFQRSSLRIAATLPKSKQF